MSRLIFERFCCVVFFLCALDNKITASPSKSLKEDGVYDNSNKLAACDAQSPSKQEHGGGNFSSSDAFRASHFALAEGCNKQSLQPMIRKNLLLNKESATLAQIPSLQSHPLTAPRLSGLALLPVRHSVQTSDGIAAGALNKQIDTSNAPLARPTTDQPLAVPSIADTDRHKAHLSHSPVVVAGESSPCPSAEAASDPRTEENRSMGQFLHSLHVRTYHSNLFADDGTVRTSNTVPKASVALVKSASEMFFANHTHAAAVTSSSPVVSPFLNVHLSFLSNTTSAFLPATRPSLLTLSYPKWYHEETKVATIGCAQHETDSLSLRRAVYEINQRRVSFRFFSRTPYPSLHASSSSAIPTASHLPVVQLSEHAYQLLDLLWFTLERHLLPPDSETTALPRHSDTPLESFARSLQPLLAQPCLIQSPEHAYVNPVLADESSRLFHPLAPLVLPCSVRTQGNVTALAPENDAHALAIALAVQHVCEAGAQTLDQLFLLLQSQASVAIHAAARNFLTFYNDLTVVIDSVSFSLSLFSACRHTKHSFRVDPPYLIPPLQLLFTEAQRLRESTLTCLRQTVKTHFDCALSALPNMAETQLNVSKNVVAVASPESEGVSRLLIEHLTLLNETAKLTPLTKQLCVSQVVTTLFTSFLTFLQFPLRKGNTTQTGLRGCLDGANFVASQPFVSRSDATQLRRQMQLVKDWLGQHMCSADHDKPSVTPCLHVSLQDFGGSHFDSVTSSKRGSICTADLLLALPVHQRLDDVLCVLSDPEPFWRYHRLKKNASRTAAPDAETDHFTSALAARIVDLDVWLALCKP